MFCLNTVDNELCRANKICSVNKNKPKQLVLKSCFFYIYTFLKINRNLVLFNKWSTILFLPVKDFMEDTKPFTVWAEAGF